MDVNHGKRSADQAEGGETDRPLMESGAPGKQVQPVSALAPGEGQAEGVAAKERSVMLDMDDDVEDEGSMLDATAAKGPLQADGIQEKQGIEMTSAPAESEPVKKYGAAAGKKPPVFRKSYKEAGCCSKILYNYAWFMIDSMRKNGNVMTEEMIEDMRLNENETEEYIEYFQKLLADGDKALSE